MQKCVFQSTNILLVFAHGLPTTSAFCCNLVRAGLVAVLHQGFLDLIPRLPNVQQKRRRCRLLWDLERIQTPCRLLVLGHQRLRRRVRVLRLELVHSVLHIREVGQLIIQMAVK